MLVDSIIANVTVTYFSYIDVNF